MSINKFNDAVEKAKENLDKANIIIPNYTKQAVFNPYVQVFAAAVSDKLANLTKNDIMVLFGILKLTQFGNLVSFNQAGLAESLGKTKPVVSRSITALIKNEILLKSKKYGTFLNPALVIKGALDGITLDMWIEVQLLGYESPLKAVRNTINKQKKASATAASISSTELPF